MAAKGLFADTAPLAEPHFARLWRANIVTVVGAQLTVVAVPAQLYAITGSSQYVGLSGVFGLVPLVVFGLWGGALADHFDRRKLLIATTIGLIATSGVFFAQAALNANNVWLLLSIFAVQQACFGVNQPTRSAVLPRLLPEAQLASANTLNMTVSTAGGIAGPLVGGALLPVFGFSWLYLIDTLCLFATLYAVVKLPPIPVENAKGSPGLRSVIDGFAYLRWHGVLLVSFLADLVAMVAGMPRALFPEIAHRSFHGPNEGGMQFALLSVGIAAGAMVGGVFSGWVSRVRRQGLAVIVCVVVWGLGIVGVGVGVFLSAAWTLPALIFCVAMLVVAGAADMASAAFRQAILLAAADDSVRGRLQGVFMVVVVGGPRIADVLHGFAAGVFGTGWTTLGGGVLVVVLILVIARAIPEFVRYRRPDLS